ncbi:MAG: hypothetical protein WD036_11210, partial [Bauldia sp.]
MDIELADADAGVAIAISVLSDYLAELSRIGTLPQVVELERVINGTPFDVTVRIDPPAFELAVPEGEPAYTRLLLTGTIEVRPDGQPNAPPIELPLDAAVRLSLVLVPGDPVEEVGLRYDGVDGQPAAPVTAEDIDAIFASPELAAVLDNTTIDLAGPLVEGLNASRFPEEGTRPGAEDWTVVLTLMPRQDDTDDSFAVTVGPPGTTAVPALAVVAMEVVHPGLGSKAV